MLVRSSAGNDSSDGSPQAPRTRQQPGAACDECRRRKLRCDRQKPQCGACQASGVACIVPATKPARGPKRGYLKTLQARICMETLSNFAYGCCVPADAILACTAALEGALGGQPCAPSNPPSAGGIPNATLDMGDIPDFAELGDMSAMGLGQLAWPLGISGEGDSLPSPRPISYDEKDILSTMEAPDSWSALIQDAIQPSAPPRPGRNIMPRPDAANRPNSGPQTPANTDESSSPGCSPEATIPTLVQSDL